MEKTIYDKLVLLDNIKNDIKQAIEEKNVVVGDIPYSDYPNKIREIKGGSEPINVGEIGLFFTNSQWENIPENFDFSDVEKFDYMFEKNTKLTEIDINTDKGNSFQYAFRNCLELKKAKLTQIKNSNNISSLFYNCSKLEEIECEFDFTTINNFGLCFFGCKSLKSFGDIDLRYATNSQGILYNCNNLESLGKVYCNPDKLPNILDATEYSKLTDFGGYIGLKKTYNGTGDISYMPNLSYQSCINVLNGLYDFIGNGETPDDYQVIRVSQNFIDTIGDDISIAINRGWSLVTN